MKFGGVLILLSVAISAFLISGAAYAASTPQSACNVSVTGANGTYMVPGSYACALSSIQVIGKAVQNRIVCGAGSAQIGSVVFGNYSFNNSIVNCTFSDSQVKSLNNASNNLISPYGNYSLSFSDNRSNVGIGYYFTFVSKNDIGVPKTALFITVVPLALAQAGSSFINSQDLARRVVQEEASSINYTLPRFGYYASVNSTGIIHFALEQKQVYRNRTMNFNPYWFVTPYWGWDELSYKEFNITNDMNYTPSLLYPTMQENVRFPDNATIYWNYTIIRYSNATNMTFYIDRGWQGDANNTLAYVLHNVTNESVSYKVGKQQPGIYEYIGMLKSPQAGEHDNSTTNTYGIGLPYCQIGDASQILYPGYYSMPYKNLSILHTFWLNGSLCDVPVDIVANNVTIDCRGGNINSNNLSIEVSGVRNSKIENCNIHGNGFLINGASNVSIEDTNVIADRPGDVALNISDSKGVKLSNVSIIGYANGSRIVSFNSEIITNNVNYTNGTAYINRTGYGTGMSTSNPTVAATPSRHAAQPSDYYFLIILLGAIIVCCSSVYYLVSRSISGGRSGP